MTVAHDIKVGAFFYSSWGYDQTNVDFFKVVGVTPKGVKVQRWSQSVTSADPNGSAERVVPGDGPATFAHWADGVMVGQVAASVEQKRVQQSSYDGRTRLAWTSYADLYLWDGAPKSQTGSGWGH